MGFPESEGHCQLNRHVIELADTIVRNSLRLYLTAPDLHLTHQAILVTIDPLPLHRRRFLAGSAALAASATLGCNRREAAPQAQSEPERRDVPLRVALVGTDRDAESIERGWGSVTDQPLKIETLVLDRENVGALADVVLAAARRSDVVLYPLALVAEAAVTEVIVPFSGSDFEEVVPAAASLFPALRNGAARYAGEFFAVPLGAPLPALLSVDELAAAGIVGAIR